MSRPILQLTLSLLLSLTACERPGTGTPVPEGEEFGEGITLEEILPLREVAARPDAFADRAVLVEGEVRDVCQRRGCWMVLSDGSARVQVRFKDYGFFVPKDAAGRRALVEGSVKSDVLSEADARHYAEESQHTDPAQIDGPQSVVSLIASGVRFIAAN